MGKAGKRHEMVKRTYERLACERAACMCVCVCMYACICMYVCMCALCGDAQNMPHAMTIGERQAALAVEAAQPDLFHTSGLQPKQGHGKWHRGLMCRILDTDCQETACAFAALTCCRTCQSHRVFGCALPRCFKLHRHFAQQLVTLPQRGIGSSLAPNRTNFAPNIVRQLNKADPKFIRRKCGPSNM